MKVTFHHDLQQITNETETKITPRIGEEIIFCNKKYNTTGISSSENTYKWALQSIVSLENEKSPPDSLHFKVISIWHYYTLHGLKCNIELEYILPKYPKQ